MDTDTQIDRQIDLPESKTFPGWMGGWMDGWMDVEAGLRIAYSNQKAT